MVSKKRTPRIYINPANHTLQIRLNNQAPREYMRTLTDLMGMRVAGKSFSGTDVMTRRDGLSDGSYLMGIGNDKAGNTFTKRIAIE